MIASFYRKLKIKIALLFNPKNIKIAGSCKFCGYCCQNLYLCIHNRTVMTESEFEELSARFTYLSIFRIKESTPDGLVFTCTKLKDNKCTIYSERPFICRSYPTVRMFSMNSKLHENCGFYLTAKIPFKEILDTLKK
ncbi:MAG: YkgJ family cysteine cluster protein [Candidatus Cloacimonetes bacterium]|nr:YkgJ family cysteine cluster protein [Candidatus Cloacimonadota bacterium]